MPRSVINDSDDELEPKTVRRTRAAMAASALISASVTTDSPVRRSTRNRQSLANPDGSSPESSGGSSAAPQLTRVTRRRAAAVVMDTLPVPENTRALRSRKNSVSSNISENLDVEAAPGTPKTRSIKRLSMIEPSPSTPKSSAKTRRSVRASSETKSPAPVVRATRRTRASSIDPEPSVERATKAATGLAQSAISAATPTKKRRQQASVVPTEPTLPEDNTEDIDQPEANKGVGEIPEEEIEDEISPGKTSKSSRRSASDSIHKSAKDDSLKENTDDEVKVDKNLSTTLSEKSLTIELTPVKDKSMNEKAEESEQQKQTDQAPVADTRAADIDAQKSTKSLSSSVTKTKRNSLDKSKELGMRIEDLMNKSTEEQEKSPGNKENEKLNISPDKIKKNLEFTVCSVSLVRGKSLGSTKFLSKSSEKKMNTSLDERVLSKSRYDIIAPKSTEVEDNKLVNAAKDTRDSDSEKKSQAEVPDVSKSETKNKPEEPQVAESKGENSSLKNTYTKVDETIVGSEVIEEFTLYDSNESLDGSKNEFSLTIEDDVDSDKNSSSKNILERDTAVDAFLGNSDTEEYCNSNSKIFERPNPSKNKSRKSSSEVTEGEKQDTPQRFNLNSTEPEENKQVRKRQSIENKETDKQEEESELSNKSVGDDGTINTDIEKNSNEDEDIDGGMPMDTNQDEETETNEGSPTVSPEKNSSDQQVSSVDKKNQSSNVKVSKSKPSNQVSDSDSNISIDNLFHNISAEEWNKKQKNHSPNESQTKRKTSLKRRDSKPSRDSNEETDSDDNLLSSKNKSLDEDKTEDCDHDASDDTLILNKNNSAKKAKKKRRSSVKIIAEEAESEDTDIEETVERRKSLNKSIKSNTSLVGNRADDKIQDKEDNHTNSVTTFREEGMEVDENFSEAETISSNVDDPEPLKDTNSEKRQASTKNTPENTKKKSPAKSVTKSKKSADVYHFAESSEGEENDKAFEDGTDEDEKTSRVTPREKSKEKKEHGSALKKSRTPLNRNYSIVAVVDSDSASENVTDPDGPGSDNNDDRMPGFLLNIESSADETDDSDAEKGESNNTIDSDIAKDMNLAGDNSLEYSDDNVPGDECRDSESEHSDEDDNGSDMADFVVADDDVESSASSEEELTVKNKFKRILDKSSSEEEEQVEEEEEEEEEKEDEREMEVNHEEEDNEVDEDSDAQSTNEKVKRKSLRSTPETNDSAPEEESIEESPDLHGKKLNFSFESDRVLPKMETSRGKIVHDLGESELTLLPDIKDLEKTDKKLTKFSKSVRSLLDTTIDLCTPESNATTQTKGKSPKLKKNLEEDLGVSTPDKTEKMQKDDEETEPITTPETKTPIKKKKTPKSLKKNQRDSIQLIEEAVLTKSNVSDLNKSMLTPNSESPVTKFLKKERLNESLPLLELKKRVSKTFDKKALSNMDEDEQEEDNASETSEEKEAAEESENQENDADDDVEETEEQVNGNSHRDDEEEDETDDEDSNKEDENEDLDDENYNEPDEEEEKEESSEEEISKKRKKNKKKLRNEAVEQPKIEKIEKKRKSAGRKGLTEVEEPVIDQDETNITPSKKESTKRRSKASPSGVLNGKTTESNEDDVPLNKKRHLSNAGTELTNRKKRARLESSGTPQSVIKDRKKIKIATKLDAFSHADSDSDEAPESLGFGEARTEALQEMKDVAASLKAAKEAKKKKRRDQLERIRQEKEAKIAKKSTLQGKTKPEPVKSNLKRLPEDLLDNLSDVPPRPKKKRKLSKPEEPAIVPSRSMFSPGKSTKISVKVEDYASPVSTGGGTTHFSVINLEKVKKQPKKAAAVASFRERMLARNPRQPVSAFLMYQAKQKASGKQLSSRKQA